MINFLFCSQVRQVLLYVFQSGIANSPNKKPRKIYYLHKLKINMRGDSFVSLMNVLFVLEATRHLRGQNETVAHSFLK